MFLIDGEDGVELSEFWAFGVIYTSKSKNEHQWRLNVIKFTLI